MIDLPVRALLWTPLFLRYCALKFFLFKTCGKRDLPVDDDSHILTRAEKSLETKLNDGNLFIKYTGYSLLGK